MIELDENYPSVGTTYTGQFYKCTNLGCDNEHILHFACYCSECGGELVWIDTDAIKKRELEIKKKKAEYDRKIYNLRIFLYRNVKDEYLHRIEDYLQSKYMKHMCGAYIDEVERLAWAIETNQNFFYL